MDMVKSSFDFLIAMICALLLAGCGGNGEDLSSNASLASLTLSSGQLDQVFQSGQLDYTATVSFVMASTTVTPAVADPNAMVTVNGTAVRSGNRSEAIFLGQGETVITVMVTAEDAVTSRLYSITVTRELSTSFAQQAYVKASNTDIDDHFGERGLYLGVGVALFGDTLAVGAPGEDSAATGIDGDQADNSADGSGAVYVFTREGTVWTQQAYIKASNTDSGDRFGESVALFGDTLAVGAGEEDGAATGVDGDQADDSVRDSGAVYVFTREGALWTQQAYIKASNTGSRDSFGESVVLSGDTLVVGAPGEDSAATGIDGDQADNSAGGSGAVYVFTREDTVWRQQAYIKASNTDSGDSFGESVVLSGDSIAVGALWESSTATGIDGDQADNSADASGAVYVFTREGTLWTQQAYIKASNTDSDDFFGNSVALSGNTLAVGAPREDSAATGIDGDQADNSARGSGAVYVFTREGSVWSQQAYLKAPNTDPINSFADSFGDSVALSGDTLFVGVPGEDSFFDSSGAVYMFTRKAFTGKGTAWTQQAYIKASNPSHDDRFGSSVTLSGDTLAVAAPLEDSLATGVDGDQGDYIYPDFDYIDDSYYYRGADSGAVYVHQ